MSAAKHTPGPWHLFSNSIGVGVTTGRSDVAHCSGFDSLRTLEEVESNARLIAAAPDLLEALRGAIEWMYCVEPHLRDGEPFKRNFESYKAAIAKAEGGAA